MTKISIPTELDRDDISDVMGNMIKCAKLVHSLSLFYPSARLACMTQYHPNRLSDKDKIISEELFNKKLEVMLLQDEERRKKVK